MCQRSFGGCLCTEQMVYSLLNRFGFDVIFHAAKVVLLCDINVDNLSRKNSRIGRFVQFCILYLPKGIKNSPSSLRTERVNVIQYIRLILCRFLENTQKCCNKKFNPPENKIATILHQSTFCLFLKMVDSF